MIEEKHPIKGSGGGGSSPPPAPPQPTREPDTLHSRPVSYTHLTLPTILLV